MSRPPIGVFDSGLGGLTVAAQILKRLPSESVIYLADTAHVPYGERPLEEIKGFALDITRFLRGLGAKMVVMACNMSSAVALPVAEEMFPDMPLLGVIEPGSRAAVRAADGRPIGVLATTGTVTSRAYPRTIRRMSPQTPVYEQACPAFVPLVESGRSGGPEAFDAAREYLRDFAERGIGTIILGCTHYPFLSEAIAAAADASARLIDPAHETVAEVERLLLERGIQAPCDNHAEHRFFVTGDAESFAELGSRFLGRPVARVESALWGVDIGRVYA